MVPDVPLMSMWLTLSLLHFAAEGFGFVTAIVVLLLCCQLCSLISWWVLQMLKPTNSQLMCLMYPPIPS